MAPVGKWIDGLSAEQPVREVARKVLKARLEAVWHWLPLAAEKSAEDVEYVHQLRVSSRRAVEAVRAFRRLVPGTAGDEIRARLKEIRRAADEARDYDVLYEKFARSDDIIGDGAASEIARRMQGQRREAQGPIVSTYQRLVHEGFNRLIRRIPKELRSGKGRKPFAAEAGEYLRPVVGKFLKAAHGDLSSTDVLHGFRIRGKKLRYTMEIVAFAFDPAFRKELYLQVEALQEHLGRINDHATAHVRYRDWHFNSDDPEERAFLEGLIVAEYSAIEDVLDDFFAWWTPNRAASLERRLSAYLPAPAQA